MFDDLSCHEREALVLATAYAQARRQKQSGYRLFSDVRAVTETTTFKQFLTVAKWLRTHQWAPTWREVHWQGYVRFVFQKLDPTIPMPGQLKNDRLLRDYLASAPLKVQLHERTSEEMETLYRKVLRSEFHSRRWLAALGLINHTPLS